MSKFKDFEPQQKSGKWLNLQEGENKVRIVSEYEEYGFHYDTDNQVGFACIGRNNGCEFCQIASQALIDKTNLKEQAGDEPNESDKKELEGMQKKFDKYKSKIQYLTWAIDRKDGEVKIMRYSYTVQVKLMELAKNKEYSFDTVPDYDITITRTGKKLNTKYDVIPARENSILTEEETKKINESISSLENIIKKMKDKAMPTIDIDKENEEKDNQAPPIENEVETKDLPF